MRKIILASASPRRKQILKELCLKFKVVESRYEENNHSGTSPRKLAAGHALGKAEDIAKRFGDALVIGADTIVVLGKKVIGKPKDEDDAFRILKALSGKRHDVITAFAIIDAKNKKKKVKTVTTKVFFKSLSDSQIKEYVRTGEWIGKAGGYAFQGKARNHVRKAVGSKTNVIGLPKKEFLEELKKFI